MIIFHVTRLDLLPLSSATNLRLCSLNSYLFLHIVTDILNYARLRGISRNLNFNHYPSLRSETCSLARGDEKDPFNTAIISLSISYFHILVFIWHAVLDFTLSSAGNILNIIITKNEIKKKIKVNS